ncbi:MAG TPA: response regulator [Thermoanaerobaculia bacterium]|nr:response regulator [Thermoanaerobaculia bacterium]
MSRSDPPAGVPNVLVVDDDLALRGLFTTLLTKKGFTVDTATDGRVAYDQLQRHTYSVILLDLMMPDVNGFELLEQIRRDSPTLLDRVIVMTGASQRSIEALDTSRIWGLIRKPFDIDQLVNSALACSQGRRNRGIA